MRLTSRRLCLLVTAPVLILGLAGCGSKAASPEANSPASASSGTPDGDASSAEIPSDLCGLITAAEFSTAIGKTVTTEKGPSGDCEFDQEDLRALSGSVGVVGSADTNGGFAAYVSGIDGTLTSSTDTDIPGLGDAATVKVGVPSYSSGGNLTAAGVVDHGTYLLTVNLIQGVGMSEAELTTIATDLLKLVDSKTS